MVLCGTPASCREPGQTSEHDYAISETHRKEQLGIDDIDGACASPSNTASGMRSDDSTWNASEDRPARYTEAQRLD